jgi:alpha-mannosidase
MAFFGVGNHGGGPTREQIEHVQTLARRHEDIEVRFSHPQAYFDAVASRAADLPVVQDELQHHAVGCYSVNSQLKGAHRAAEGALLAAERLACLAELWAEKAAPIAELDRLWWDLLLNQFHDTLGGSSIKQGEDEAIMALGRVVLGARELIDDAGRAVAARLDTRGPGGGAVALNPFPHPFRGYVEYEPWTEWAGWEAGDWGLVDHAGRPVPHQTVEPDAAINATDTNINRLVFRVDLPPLGYRLYRFASGLPRRQARGELSVTPDTLENEHWRLRVDPASGAITSCLDRATGTELVGPEGWNVAQVLHDDSDTWSHGVASYQQLIGLFAASEIKVCDQGPLQGSLLIERVYEGNTWLQQVILRADDPTILVRNWLTWRGQWRALKLAFEVATEGPRGYHDVPFGWLERPCNGCEVPTHMWLDVSGPPPTSSGSTERVEQVGLAVLNDAKYGCDVMGNVLRLTISRTPPYAYDKIHAIGDKCRYDWVDQGYQAFNLALLPHLGDWRETDLIARARALNLPPILITTHAHTGERPPVGSAGQLVGRELELTALKPAADGDGFVVRVADKHGRGGGGQLVWGEQSFDITLSPFEVATWRLYREGGRWHLAACDMLERPLVG